MSHEDFGRVATSPPIVASVLGAVAWAAYRLMSPKTVTVRRFLAGVVFAAFVGWVSGTVLMHYVSPDLASAVGAALGSICEKVRSLFIQKISKEKKELENG
jgi:hypothetical protein